MMQKLTAAMLVSAMLSVIPGPTPGSPASAQIAVQQTAHGYVVGVSGMV